MKRTLFAVAMLLGLGFIAAMINHQATAHAIESLTAAIKGFDAEGVGRIMGEVIALRWNQEVDKLLLVIHLFRYLGM